MWQFEWNKHLKYFKFIGNKVDLDNLLCLLITRQTLNEHPSNFKHLGIDRIYTLYQIHSDIIWYVNKDFPLENLMIGDGLYTDQINTFLGVKVADCLPIYFFCPNKKIVGIVHSGWKGTLKEIGTKMVKILLTTFNLKPSQIYSVFGPAIGVCCYEIKQDVVQLFEHFCNEKKIPKVIIRRDKKYYLDLKHANRILLETAGVKHIGDLNLCSFCQRDLLYSVRREKNTDRNLALIGYKK